MEHQFDVIIIGAGLAGLRAAIDKRLSGNDDAILRWNACARIIMNNSLVEPSKNESRESMLE